MAYIFLKLQPILLVLLFSSCSHLGGLGSKPHYFGKIPTRVIWIQVAGLGEEHLALLHFEHHDHDKSLALLQSPCIGKMWGYNLYQLRPGPYQSFLTQMTGKKNIKGQCIDYEQRPIWSYLKDGGFATALLEFGATGDQSITKPLTCTEGSSFLKDLIVWKMAKSEKTEAPYFHIQESGPYFKAGQVYYDKSCQQGPCYNDPLKNIEVLYKQFTKTLPDHLFIIRDFSYYNALKSGQMLKVKESLTEIEKIFEYFYNESLTDRRLLVLLTTAGVVQFEFPQSAEDWANLSQKGGGVLFHREALMNMVLANGAKAENFCGIFEEAEFLPRLLQKQSRQDIFWNF